MKRTALYAREAIAFAFWLYVFVKLFIFDFDVYALEHIAPGLRWFLDYKLLALMATLAILWIVQGHRAFFMFIGYVVAYPAVLVFLRLAPNAIRQWPFFLLFSPILFSAIQKARSTFALYTLAIISSLIIPTQSNKSVLAMAMVGLGIFLGVHVYRSLRKAYSMRVISRLTKFTREFRDLVDSGRFEIPTIAAGQASPTSASSNTAVQPMTNLYAFHACANIVAEKIHDLLKRRVFDLYLIASWVYTVTVTFVVYGFEYWALYRIDNASFKGADGADFWNFAGFSIGILTPSNLSHIEPVGRISTIICYSEVACSVLILVILVFSILTAAREAFREDALEFISELRITAAAVEKRVLQVYQMTLAQVELAILEKNGSLVNLIRKARGLPELPVPEGTTPSTRSPDTKAIPPK